MSVDSSKSDKWLMGSPCRRKFILNSVLLILIGTAGWPSFAIAQPVAKETVQLVVLQVSNGREIVELATRKVFLVDKDGTDLSSVLTSKNETAMTDEKGQLSIAIPLKNSCYVIPDIYSETDEDDVDLEELSIPTLTVIGVPSVKKPIKKSIVCRKLDCVRNEDALAELTHIHSLIKDSVNSKELTEFKNRIGSAMSKLEDHIENLGSPTVQPLKPVTVSLVAVLAGTGINLFASNAALPPALDMSNGNWIVQDAWGGVVADGRTRPVENEVLSVPLLPGQLYCVTMASNLEVENVLIPPTSVWICPSKGDPETILPADVIFDSRVAIHFEEINSMNRDFLRTSLLRSREQITPAVDAEIDDHAPVISILAQIDGLLAMLDNGNAFADLRDTPKPLEIFVHLVKASPGVDAEWATLFNTATHAANRNTKFWAICDTTSKDSFAQLFATQRNARTMERFQILGYLPMVKVINGQQVAVPENALMAEAKQWSDYGVRGVYIDFFDAANAQRLGPFLKQLQLSVFAQLRSPIFDDSLYSTPFIDAFILSDGTNADYSTIRDLTQRQLLQVGDPEKIPESKGFGAVERNAPNLDIALDTMVDARCRYISIGSPQLVFNADGQPVLLDQLALPSFWNSYVQRVEIFNQKSKMVWNNLYRQKLVPIPGRK